MRLHGCHTALMTPFRSSRIDELSLIRLIRSQIAAGVQGLVPCGSTGEAATLHFDERRRVIQLCVAGARGKAIVTAGIASNATEKAIAEARAAEALGVDALLVLAPYYNKPTAEGLFLHFAAIARSVTTPIVIYNIPGRTAVNILPATLARLAHRFRNIIGVKEAAGSLDQVSEILSACPRRFSVLSGDDSLTVPMMSIGASGVVSVISNLLPRETVRLCADALRGDFAAARRAHARLFPLIKALFAETNPIPVKAAAAALGLCANELRLPLTPLSRKGRQRLLAELKPWRGRRP